jgi:cytosine/adenosine deaminase-related metal-dependent hydrolase
MHDGRTDAATIVDGPGGAPGTGDVAIADGRDSAVGEVDGAARETVIADGAIVTPGWVDMRTHYDGQVGRGDTLDPFLQQWRDQHPHGHLLMPQIALRAVGFVTSIFTCHMFRRRKTFVAMAHLPCA